jgi:homoserine kinase
VVSPHIELRTSDARKILKASVPLGSAISQWGNVAALVAGIYRNDPELIGRSLADTIIEPERGQLIPGYQAVKAAAKDGGALGCSISGSGPALFALCRSESDAHRIGSMMAEAFMTAAGVTADIHISEINTEGAKVIRRD